MSFSMKQQKLKDYLGDFEEYVDTGLRCRKGSELRSRWLNPTYQNGDFKKDSIPHTSGVCPCSTPIQVHCLILNIKTGRLEFVGNECIKRFNGHYKTCIGCHKRLRRKKSIRCLSCEEIFIAKEEGSRIGFGKYACSNLGNLVGVDDAYLQWMTGYGLLREYLRQELRAIIPMTKIQNGKYRGKTFIWIQANDRSYYSWIKSNFAKSLVEYL